VWDSFEIALRLNEQENIYGVAIFISCIGSEALGIYNRLPFENEEHKHKMSKVMELMERHCIGQTKTSFMRETFDVYFTAVRTLAKICNFGPAHQQANSSKNRLWNFRDRNQKKKTTARAEINSPEVY